MARNKKKNDAGTGEKVITGDLQNSVIRVKKNESSEIGVKTCDVSGCKTKMKAKKAAETINKPVSTSQSGNCGSKSKITTETINTLVSKSQSRNGGSKSKKTSETVNKPVSTSQSSNGGSKSTKTTETINKLVLTSQSSNGGSKSKETTETINKPVSTSQSSNGGSKSKETTETINKPVSTSQSSNGGSKSKETTETINKPVSTSQSSNGGSKSKKTTDTINKPVSTSQSSNGGSKSKKTTDTINKPVSTSQSSNGGSKSKKTTETINKPLSTSQSSNGGSKSKKNNPMTANQERQATTLEKQKSKPTKKDSQTKKMETNLRPSDIRYSQSSISSQFKDGTNIGQLLDDIFFGRCFASAIPQIEVSHIEGHWVSADNRRLWVFKQLEILGRLDFITVKVSKRIYIGKLTSENAGMVVEIRNGDPTGVVYALMYDGQNQNTDDDSAEEPKDLAPESKRKRKRRRRKRKPKTSHENNNNTDKPEHEITSLDHLKTAPNDIDLDTCRENPLDELETLLHFNQDLVDEDTYYEEYVYNDSDGVTCLSDTALLSENVVLEVATDSHWAECEKLLKTYHVETALSKYRERHPSSEDSELSDSFDVSALTHNHELASHIRLSDCTGADFEKQHEGRNVFYPQEYFAQTSAQNDFSESADDNGLNHSWDICQTEPDFSYRCDADSELCCKYKCARCTRMLFYRELDIGPYYEPPCQCTTAINRSPQYLVVTESTAVKTTFKDKSILAKLSRGVDTAVGFFNKIFS
ncbi:uncharacterized protein LOC123564354 [Mercenaria mercenaria]|uniref:uncharacterized protein LOC123564354 n=1 Tax=Mercenaria mercenaria TaxID=6596 RepID=UPI00234EDF70|nr:uncharacterized protein LOC123564354 [Mercenaria mercenaria]